MVITSFTAINHSFAAYTIKDKTIYGMNTLNALCMVTYNKTKLKWTFTHNMRFNAVLNKSSKKSIITIVTSIITKKTYFNSHVTQHYYKLEIL